MAKAYFFDRKYTEAKSTFLDYFRLENSNKKVSSYFHHAYCLDQLNEENKALMYYNAFLKEYRSSTARNNRALIFEKLERFDDAEKDFLIALELDPGDDLYLRNLCNLYFEKDKNAEIITILSNYDLSRKDVELSKLLAKVLAKLNRKHEAIEKIKCYCKMKNWKSEDVIEREINEVLECLP